MTAARRLAAILAADVVGYSRLMGEDEAGTARAVRERREAARPIVAGSAGGSSRRWATALLLEFPSVVAAVECAIAIQKLMAERNADTPEDKRILYRIGVNLGDVLIEGDDILGDGVNIAARLEGIASPAAFAFGRRLRSRARQDRRAFRRSRREGPQEHRPAGAGLCAQARRRTARRPPPPPPRRKLQGPPRLSIVVLPFANIGGDPEQELFRRRGHREPDDRSLAHSRRLRDRPQHGVHLQGQAAST